MDCNEYFIQAKVIQQFRDVLIVRQQLSYLKVIHPVSSTIYRVRGVPAPPLPQHRPFTLRMRPSAPLQAG